jgi:hypothetical protein
VCVNVCEEDGTEGCDIYQCSVINVFRQKRMGRRGCHEQLHIFLASSLDAAASIKRDLSPQ